ncbi:MAG: AzlC family ABC transporter permease [Chloroflexi bacterium]|nr:AzlC family ABC transporter permease [Chloroflexota bacterium]
MNLPVTDNQSTPISELISGIKAELPITLGVIPFGMIYGVLALAGGLTPALAQAMSSIVFAGSAQFIAAQLIGSSAPGAILLLTTFIVNLRHMLYSASLAPHLRHLSPLWRWLLAYLLTDEAYAVTILHYEKDTATMPTAVSTPLNAGVSINKHYFFLGAGLTLWVSWQISTAVGIFIGAQVPASWSLDFTLALTFIGLVIPALKNRADVAAAVAAGLVAVLVNGLPFKLGLILAAAAGIFVGVQVENRK